MRVSFWGTRGSIPAPGTHTVRYGGNTACVSVQGRHGPLLILDAGSGIRLLGKAIAATRRPSISVLFLSHAHWDHLHGFPFFEPAYRSSTYLCVTGNLAAARLLEEILSGRLEHTLSPVSLLSMAADIQFSEMGAVEQIGSCRVQPFPTRHPGGGTGFKITDGDRRIVYMTDHELPAEEREWAPWLTACEGADLLIHDAQYTDDELSAHVGWGHSSASQATRLALLAGVSRVALFHHDPDRSDQEIDQMVESCRLMAVISGRRLEVFAARDGQTVDLDLRKPRVKPEAGIRAAGSRAPSPEV